MRFLVLLSLVLASAAGSVVMSGARFQALCAERAVRISLRTAVRINCLSLLAAVVSPMGVVGDGLRTHMLVKKHHAQLADSIGVVILDRVAGLHRVGGGGGGRPRVRRRHAAHRTHPVGALDRQCRRGGGDRPPLPRRPNGTATRPAPAQRAMGDPTRKARGARRNGAEIEAGDRHVAGRSVARGGQRRCALFRLLGFVQPPTMLIAAGTGFVPLLEALPSSFIGIGAHEGRVGVPPDRVRRSPRVRPPRRNDRLGPAGHVDRCGRARHGTSRRKAATLASFAWRATAP